MRKKFHSGQTLVEVIISVAVTVVLSISLITVTLITQRAARSARNKAQASKLAEQYVEQLRIYRDRIGYSSLPVNNACYFIVATDPDPKNWTINATNVSTGSVLGLCPAGETNLILNGVTFNRKYGISPAPSPSNGRLFTVTVSWTEQGTSKTVTNNIVFSDWEGTQ